MRVASRPLSWLLLSALLPMVLGLPADFLVHPGDHGESHETLTWSGSSPDGSGHEACDAWEAESVEHAAHQGIQFEPLAGLHHGDHAALCPACGHGLSVTLAVAGRQSVDPLGSSVALHRFSAPLDPRLAHARPRAPPAFV